MSLAAKFFVFDVESVGLHGEGWAVGGGIYDMLGRRQSEFCFVCPSRRARGGDEGRKWIIENCPDMAVTHETPKELRAAFWKEWLKAKSEGAVAVADCGWPVEARFLADCVNDEPSRFWEGPYPLHDLASILLSKGTDPLEHMDRLPDESPIHNPLNDARQSARLLVNALAPPV